MIASTPFHHETKKRENRMCYAQHVWVASFGIGVGVLSAPMPAAIATPLTYELVDVMFSPAGKANGSFTIDSTTGSVLTGEIRTSPSGGSFSGSTYTNLNGSIQEPFFYLTAEAEGSDSIFYRLFLSVDAAALGEARISTRNFTLFERALFGSPTGFTLAERGAIADAPGELVKSDSSAAIPEPFTVAGAIVACGVGAILRRQARS